MRKISVRHVLAFTILALFGILVAVLTRNYQAAAPEEVVGSLPADVDLSLNEVHYTETREGVPRWTLDADSAAHTLGDGVTRIENVHMTFFNLEGYGDVVLTAREGIFRAETGDVDAVGDVVVRSPSGYVFHSDRLQYSDADGQIRTDDPVRIVSEGMEVTGRGMRLNVHDQTFVLFSDVKARWSGEKRGKG